MSSTNQLQKETAFQQKLTHETSGILRSPKLPSLIEFLVYMIICMYVCIIIQYSIPSLHHLVAGLCFCFQLFVSLLSSCLRMHFDHAKLEGVGSEGAAPAPHTHNHHFFVVCFFCCFLMRTIMYNIQKYLIIDYTIQINTAMMVLLLGCCCCFCPSFSSSCFCSCSFKFYIYRLYHIFLLLFLFLSCSPCSSSSCCSRFCNSCFCCPCCSCSCSLFLFLLVLLFWLVRG